MSKDSISKFSAVDASLGYLYQVRSALLWALRRLKAEPDFLVSIETLDDVTFESSGGDPTDLLQLKHHRTGAGNLTNASPDLWKSLRIWFEGHSSGNIPLEAALYLITTGISSEHTAAWYLRPSTRDIAAAQQILDAIPSTSTNEANISAYQAYLAVSPSDRSAIIDRISVLDATPNVSDLDGELYQEIYWAVKREHHSSFLERLEGWWFQRILRQLAGVIVGQINSAEIEAKMSDLREQYKQEALPIDDDLLEFTLDDATIVAHTNSNFVRQIELITANKKRIMAAIRDYYRAFEQRSRWIRDVLVVDVELHKYEKHLIEEWELTFEAIRDELGDAATEEVKKAAALSILSWAERTTIPIRPNVTQSFVSRGSLHMLSDSLRIGWHPEFRERLAQLFST